MSDVLKNMVSDPSLLQFDESYWKYMTAGFGVHLENYLTVFGKSRTIPSEADWRQLPFGNNESDWQWRRQSLAVIQNEIKNEKFKTVLEIGAWNGWLTKHLAQQVQTVIAADYFICPFDGIGNIHVFSDNIEAVQCNLETIAEDFKPGTFDLIVVNHCLSYMENPAQYIQKLVSLLAPNGKIISVGNTFFGKPGNKIERNSADAKAFEAQYKMPLYIAPVKGYMDSEDQKILKRSGFKIQKYKGKWMQNTLAFFNKRKPVYVSIIYN